MPENKPTLTGNTVASVLIEYLFVLAPTIILVIAIVDSGDAVSVLPNKPEIGASSVILLGLTIVKMISALSYKGAKKSLIHLVITGIMLIGVIPSAIITFRVYTNQNGMESDFLTGLALTQVVFFVGSSLIFLIIGIVAETLNRATN